MSALSLTLAIALAQAAPWAPGGPSQAEDLIISLVTFSPGDDLPELWGHTSLVVEDKQRNHGRLYNYGMFAFETFVPNFIQGRLEFWVADAPIGATYDFYRTVLNRDVRVQELDLTPTEAMSVARALAINVEPANRLYLYHHYNDNCATRPRDIIDDAVKGQLKQATAVPARMSLREHTRRYSSAQPPVSLLLDYLQNDELERPITQQHEAFLPDELEAQVQRLTVTHDDGRSGPLVRRQYVVYQSPRPRPPEVPPRWELRLFLLGLAFSLVALGLGHLARDGKRLPRIALGVQLSLFGLLIGTLAVALLLIGAFTNHSVAHRNENLLCFSPLLFAVAPLGLMLAFGRPRAIKWLRAVFVLCAALNVLGVALKVLPAFDQANWNLILLSLPINLGLAALFTLWHRRATSS